VRFIALLIAAAGSLVAQWVPGGIGSVSAGSADKAATVSLRPFGSAAAVPAQVVAVTPSTIQFIVPTTTPLGPAQAIYRRGDGVTQWAAGAVVASNFVLSSKAAQVIDAKGTAQLTMLRPASNNSSVVLWGTGLGNAKSVTVTLGGVPQKLLYAGQATPGLDQINFAIAPGTPDGCYLRLVVAYDAQTVSSYLSKSPNGSPCAHPFGLSPGDLATLQQGDGITVNVLQTSSDLTVASAEHTSRSESASMNSSYWGQTQMQNWFAPAPATAGCILNSPLSVPFVLDPLAGLGISFAPLATLSNAQNRLTLPFSLPGVDAGFSAVPASKLDGGSWTLTAGTLQVQLAIPPSIRMNGDARLVMSRNKDQSITWPAQGYGPNASASLSLTVAGTSASVSCFTSAASGVITVPGNLLAQLPAGAGTATLIISTAGDSLGANAGVPVVLAARTSDTRPVDLQ
jgi:uncharacterized protein (TIGR03437 family)